MYSAPLTTHTNTHTPNIWATNSRTLKFSHVLLLFWLEPSRLAAKNIIQMKIVYFAIFMFFVFSSFWLLVYNFFQCFVSLILLTLSLYLRKWKRKYKKSAVLSKKVLSMIKHSAFQIKDNMETFKATANLLINCIPKTKQNRKPREDKNFLTDTTPVELGVKTMKNITNFLMNNLFSSNYYHPPSLPHVSTFIVQFLVFYTLENLESELNCYVIRYLFELL